MEKKNKTYSIEKSPLYGLKSRKKLLELFYIKDYKMLEIVDSVKKVSETFKCCNRKFHPEDTIVKIGNGFRLVPYYRHSGHGPRQEMSGELF